MKLHRVSHPCPKCGYGYHARGGRYVCCGTSVAKESEIKIHKRKRHGNQTQNLAIAEGPAQIAASFVAQRNFGSLNEGPGPEAQLKLFK